MTITTNVTAATRKDIAFWASHSQWPLAVFWNEAIVQHSKISKRGKLPCQPKTLLWFNSSPASPAKNGRCDDLRFPVSELDLGSYVRHTNHVITLFNVSISSLFAPPGHLAVCLLMCWSRGLVPAVLETDCVPWKMHHWADVSDMLSTFFWAEPPNHWFFLSTAHNRSPFAVFGFFFLFFLFSVFFLFIFVWAFLGCLEVDPNWFAMILYLRRCHADSPRSRTDVVFFGGLFPTISHPAFLGFTGLPGRRVRSHNCGLCLSAFSPRNPTPRNFDSRFVFFWGVFDF